VTAPKGSRKLTAQLQAMGIVLIGFLASVVTKAPAELFAAFVGGIVGIHSGFAWGNSKEHEHAAAAKQREAV